MFDVLVRMAALIAAGALWRSLRPGGLDADAVRLALTGLVYYLLLPALVLLVLWRAPLGLDSGRIALAAAAGVLSGLLVSGLFCRLAQIPVRAAGALMLASAFPNATYLGLPVLESALGPWARSIAIQYDLFACTPLLLSVGILVAQRCGTGGSGATPAGLLRVPPLWAAVVAVLLNGVDAAPPSWLYGALEMLGSGVVPLMLLSLGMSLRWDTLHWRILPPLLPVLLFQLLLMPLLVLGLTPWLHLDDGVRTAVVLEAAMPSMLLGLVICDRHGLDTALYAAAVTLSTALSIATLPLWFAWLTG